MNRFDRIYSQHKKLLDLQKNPPENFIEQIRLFISDIKKSGGVIYDLEERDQLRALIQYWTNAAYEIEPGGGYQPTILDEYIGRPVHNVNWSVVIGSGLTITILIILIRIAQYSHVPTNTVPITSNMTIIGSNISNAVSETPSKAITPSITPEKVNLTPTILSTPFASGPTVTLTDPTNGQEITPLVNFQGNYQNLREGWSIHVLLKSFIEQGKLYPLAPYYLIKEKEKTGSWNISTDLSKMVDIGKPDQYVVIIVVVTSEQIRNQFTQSMKTGFEAIPGDAIVFEDQTTFLTRKAYTKLDGTFLVYSSTNTDNGNSDIFLTSDDGSGKVNISNTPNFNETDPCFSPDGKKFVYIAQQRLNSGIMIYYLNSMTISDGKVETLYKEANVVYEHPRWSPDGRYIAFSKKPIDKNNATYWNLFLFDLQEDNNDEKLIQITNGKPSDRYPSWMPDSKTLIFVSSTKGTSTYGFISLNINDPSNMRLIYDTDLNEVDTAVSPDGKWLAYIGYASADGFHDIFLLDMETKKASRIIETDGLEESPTWSPDSNRIYFTGYYLGQGINIWSSDKTGNNRTIITKDSNNHSPNLSKLDTFLPKD